MDDESAVTLGTDGTVLLVGAKRDYDLYSFVTDQTVTAPLPGTVVDGIPIMPGARGYKVVWSEPLKSAVFFGGYGGTVKSNGTVTFYNAEKKTWSTKRTTGVINEMTAEHCMAISMC
ncbi:hypothetical protein BGZ73_007408 [Actinomortierella ambigua]|nr:hypothetical protein BGZ73_007408 [Actinomortierella ambigua]